MGRDLTAELEDWDGTWPAAWNPQVGEILVGKVVQYGEGPSAYGPVRTVIIEREDGRGRVSVWLSSTVLLALFERERPKVGERIGLRYFGKVETRSGRPCRRYHLIVDRPQPDSPSFAPLGGELQDADDADGAGDPFEDEPAGPYGADVLRRR